MHSWKRFLGGCLVAGMLALSGCGGGGDSAPATSTGKFIDAPVKGLQYVSGGIKGVTGADGSFTYEVGKPVKFMIGDIVLGEATGKALMTPIDLSATANADVNTTDVVAMVRLLMSLSSTDPASGIITIPTDTLAKAVGVKIDFTSDDVATKIADLPKPWKNGVVTEAEAKSHFADSLRNINPAVTPSTSGFTADMLAGKKLQHTFDSGTATFTFNTDGTILFSNSITATGTWNIDQDGILTVNFNVTPADGLVYSLVKDNGTTLTVDYKHTGASGWESTSVILTFVPVVSGFTTEMLAGKKLQHTFTAGTATFTFNTDGTILFTRNTTSATGTWNISQDGILTVNFNVMPADGLVYSLVKDNGTTLTVDYKHTGASGWESTSVILTFVQ